MKKSLLITTALAMLAAAGGDAMADPVYAPFRCYHFSLLGKQCNPLGYQIFSNLSACETFRAGIRGTHSGVLTDQHEPVGWADECDELDRPTWHRAD